jgi:hypothetical protein
MNDVSLNEWMNLLRECSNSRKRTELQNELVAADTSPGRVGLIPKEDFIKGLQLEDYVANRIVTIYAYGNGDMIDYKTFLSDLAARCGVFTVDLESQVEVLKKHAQTLLRELNERMETIEKDNLIETLEIANMELQRRAEELALIKKSIGANARNTSRQSGLRIRE